MTNYTYTKNIPLGTHSPSQDYSKMQVNTNSTNDIIAEDHISFNNANGGFHTVIREYSPADRTRSGVGATTNNFPAATVGINKIFSAFYTPDTTGGTADTQLFTLTGGGGISQLTGNSTAGITEGWCWVGGILVQWGIGTFVAPVADHKVVDITFKDRVAGAIPFPNNIFNIQCTLQIASAATTTASNTIAVRSFSTTTFRAVYNSSSSSGSSLFPGFYWLAWGN